MPIKAAASPQEKRRSVFLSGRRKEPLMNGREMIAENPGVLRYQAVEVLTHIGRVAGEGLDASTLDSETTTVERSSSSNDSSRVNH